MSVSELAKKTVSTLREEGVGRLLEKTKNYVGDVVRRKRRKPSNVAFKDILFINGCDTKVPHPARYRVMHQMEQLFSCGVVSEEIYYTDLQLDQVRNYRCFVFFRCPCTDMVKYFIESAKKLHKTVFFDIDDLVVDTKYTNEICYLSELSAKELSLIHI